jgi:hypothetical protein
MSAETLTPNAYGLVPVEMLISEAGLGLIKGEIRGVSPEVAERMIANKAAKLVPHPAKTPKTAAAG